MKSTRNKKKLVLTKKTVANLDGPELNQAKGGRTWTDPIICCQPTIYTDCYSCEVTCFSYCQECTVPNTMAFPCHWETEGCVTNPNLTCKTQPGGTITVP